MHFISKKNTHLTLQEDGNGVQCITVTWCIISQWMTVIQNCVSYHMLIDLWLLICTKIIPGIYNLYLLNIYVFCVFPETKTA